MLPSMPYDSKNLVEDWRGDSRAIQKYGFIHHFIPDPDTKTRSKLLSTQAVLIYFIVLTLIFGLFKLIPFIKPGVLGYASNIHIGELLSSTNKERGKAGLSELKINSALSEAAEEKAKDMFAKGYWAHVAPDGKEPWDFILAQNYDYSYAGENLAKNFDDSDEVVRAWYNSPSHRENLLSKNYNEVGFAVVNGVLDGYETTLVVQMFGKVRTPTYTASAPEKPAPVVEEAPSVEIPEEPAVSEERTLAEVPADNVQPAIDVSSAVRSVNIVFGGFLVSLLGLDIWFSKKFGIKKVTGHTLAHIAFLIMAFVGVWFAVAPGRIL
ncbi:MAG: CAP domain-containing protein [Patescibacteria group bacterium]|jgi:hypothetical protein